MKSTTYAAIDIGSNAVRLLIKRIDTSEQAPPAFTKLLFLRYPLRLGFDVFKTGRVSEAKAGKMVRLMKAYRQLMKLYDVEVYRACATSAMRDAANGAELIAEVLRKAKLQIDIIAGDEEARIVYNNHVEQMQDREGNFLYVDVGGGSTEINLLCDGKLTTSRSYNIGTVRILEGGVPPVAWQTFSDELEALARDIPSIHIIGSGGNINKLYRMSGKEDRSLPLTIAELQGLYNQLAPLTAEQRMTDFHLKADRADVIVPAARIFLTVAGAVGAEDIFVPVIGLGDGLIDTLYKESGGHAFPTA